MNKQIERQITQVFNEVYKKIFTKERCLQLSKGSRDDVMSAIVKIQDLNSYNKFAEKFAKELAKKGLANKKGVWRKYFEAAKSRNVIGLEPTYTAFEYKMMSKAIEHNFKMIKSIPNEIMEMLNHKYTSTLIEQVAKGTLPRGSFQKELAKHGAKKAGLIARTETAKLQSAIMENRATELGSICYRWRASKDKRTRPSHREMEGVIVLWRPDGQKPLRDNMRGNAGEFPNCRCDIDPIFSIDEFTNSTYKVYNYNIDRIESMTKTKLIEFIRNSGVKI